VLVDDIDKTSASLAELRGHGVRIAVDDFGTGYSSLSYLRTLPLDIIKIDRSFVTAVALDPATSAVARSIVALAEALGLSVTAEGIETATELDELVRLGCGFGQGFHLARPVPATEIPRLATTLRARATAAGHAVTA
jgi:EAL domain-containing protein (putative c-di-GMP-specific phosphodiesterase class I)